MKKLIFLISLLFLKSSSLYAITAGELLEVHKVTTTEMNSITTAQVGSLIYNLSEHTLYFYTGAVWKRLRSTDGETIIHAGNGILVTGSGTTTAPYTIGAN